MVSEILLKNYSPVSSLQNSVGKKMYPSVLAGIRYFFIPNMGVFAELGYNLAIIKAGLPFKFGEKVKVYLY